MARGADPERRRAHVSGRSRGVCSAHAICGALRSSTARALYQFHERLPCAATGSDKSQGDQGMAEPEEDGLPEDISRLERDQVAEAMTGVLRD